MPQGGRWAVHWAGTPWPDGLGDGIILSCFHKIVRCREGRAAGPAHWDAKLGRFCEGSRVGPYGLTFIWGGGQGNGGTDNNIQHRKGLKGGATGHPANKTEFYGSGRGTRGNATGDALQRGPPCGVRGQGKQSQAGGLEDARGSDCLAHGTPNAGDGACGGRVGRCAAATLWPRLAVAPLAL